MQGGIVMTENLEGGENDLNNGEIHINRGFELMLRPRKRKEEEPPPKTFQVKFGNMISFFNREIEFYLDFHLDIRKSSFNQGEE